MLIPFVKMQGNGNDFVLMDDVAGRVELDGPRVRRLAHRHFGIGCDQLLVAEAPTVPAAAIAIRIFNADGSLARQCGNGLRCFGRFVHDRGLVRAQRFDVETAGGVVAVELLPGAAVRTWIGVPGLDPEQVPVRLQGRGPSHQLEVDGEPIRLTALSLGNPHAVIQVDDVDTAPVHRLGPAVQALEIFPHGVNVGFMQVQDPRHIRLRVFERGVGETLACGSGACAAVVAGVLLGLLEREVTVTLAGGELAVAWPGARSAVELTGPATYVFTGEVEL